MRPAEHRQEGRGALLLDEARRGVEQVEQSATGAEVTRVRV